MSLLDDLNHIIDGRIKETTQDSSFVTTQLTQSVGSNGMGTIISISESATTGKTITVRMSDGRLVTALPGPTLLTVGQSVTVCGGRVFGQ
jgi:hypothetical protein